MPEYVASDVQDLRDSDSDDAVTLLLGVSGDRDEFARHVEETGATVDAKLGRATLRVTTTKALVDDLCTLSDLKSIELEHEDVRTLDEGNGDSRRRLTRS